MARTRAAKSKTSLNHYGLRPEEDEKLKRLLNEQEMSASALVRRLLRNWIRIQKTL